MSYRRQNEPGLPFTLKKTFLVELRNRDIAVVDHRSTGRYSISMFYILSTFPYVFETCSREGRGDGDIALRHL